MLLSRPVSLPLASYDLENATLPRPDSDQPMPMTEAAPRAADGVELQDRLMRPLGDLRISVIDRCNFRCTFCMPADREYDFLPRDELLTFEELTLLARVFVDLGVSKIRLTGGEPLLRKDLPFLVGMLAEIKGVNDLALTTNGVLLERTAQSLAAAGLKRVTVSLESLKDEVYGKINGVGQPVEPVLRGIAAAQEAGLQVKVNVVVQRGVNDGEIVDLARELKRRRCTARFIEFMDVGTLNSWTEANVLSAREIIEQIDRELPLEALPRNQSSDTALRYRYLDDAVEVGAIASITEPFCGACNRARLTSDGSMYTCLFGSRGLDLKTVLRSGAKSSVIRELISEHWRRRDDRYSEQRAQRMQTGVFGSEPKVEMYRIGG